MEVAKDTLIIPIDTASPYCLIVLMHEYNQFRGNTACHLTSAISPVEMHESINIISGFVNKPLA